VSRLSASLLADGGAAGSSAEDFFRSPEFLAAESATHTLVIGEASAPRAALPLIVRPIPGEDSLADATSPYGYPGGALDGDRLDAADVDWSSTGLVSAFIREAVERPVFAAAAERGRLQIADPAGERGVRPRLREQIRAAERAGYAVERIAGPGTEAAQLEGFQGAYTETMRRAGAAERYFYGPGYVQAVLSSPAAALLLSRAPGGEPAAAAIAVRSGGFLHYFLGGTADEHLSASPMKGLFAAMIELAGELSMPLNLGGGLSPGDGLERFKRGFANAELPFRTAELVCDPTVYGRLSGASPAASVASATSSASFFPAYRAHSA
jgi:hypothetical protein